MPVNTDTLYIIIQNHLGDCCRYPNGFALPKGWFPPVNDMLRVAPNSYIPIYDNSGNLNPQLMSLKRFDGTENIPF